MIYRAIGVMSGSSLDGLDIAFAEFGENGGKWIYEIKNAECFTYTADWVERLKNASSLPAREYQLLHAEFGRHIGEQVNQFISKNELHYQAALIASHGHTAFHVPSKKMTAQLGDGASIAAATGLPVVTDLRSVDVAFGGQGAPIVPIGEKMLLGNYRFFLNLGGIANVSFNTESYVAFDICAANRVLNMLSADAGKEYDDKGKIASGGKIDNILLNSLNNLDYYQLPHPKSLSNDFGTDIVYPIVRAARLSVEDGLRTYVEHVVVQVREALSPAVARDATPGSMLVTGGGAFNDFLIDRLSHELSMLEIEVVIPEDTLVKYKEAMVMAFMGVLRWRQEYNVLSSVTGAARNSINGALWIGQEA